VIFQKAPVAWTDKRLAEACTRAASTPIALGREAAAWRAASLSFMEAQRAKDAGNDERATGLRASAFETLHTAGLRVEQAITGAHLEDAMQAPAGQPTPAQHKASMLAECTARMLYLRNVGEASGPQYAEGAAVHYGAAACYERAIREWNAGKTAPAMAWQKAAEQTLANHLVTAPWHRSTGPEQITP
jgi:hypothetical protein